MPHTQPQKFKCGHCDQRFESVLAIARHLVKNHPNGDDSADSEQREEYETTIVRRCLREELARRVSETDLDAEVEKRVPTSSKSFVTTKSIVASRTLAPKKITSAPRYFSLPFNPPAPHLPCSATKTNLTPSTTA